MAESTIQYNFKRPDGEFGLAEWQTRLTDAQTAATKCVEALRANGAVGQTVEIVSRSMSVEYTEPAMHTSIPV